MSILASDFEEVFGSTQVGAICPYAYVGWISYIIEDCPKVIHDSMTDDILRAFFATDTLLFGEMFGTAIASIIYQKGHLLRFHRRECFLEYETIGIRKHPTLYGSDDKFKYDLHVVLDNEEMIMMKIPVDPVPEWVDGETYVINNPYHQS